MQSAIAAMQPYFFPYLGYIQLMTATKVLVLHDQLDYIKRGFMHRNNYLQPGVGAKRFGVELRSGTTSGSIDSVALSENVKWRTVLLKQLSTAYSKAPFFDDVMPIIEAVINLETSSLASMNVASVAAVRDYLDLDCEIKIMSKDYPHFEKQFLMGAYRSSESEGLDEKHSRILELCASFSVDTFVNPIGGQAVYQRDEMIRRGVNLLFLKTGAPEYRQRHSSEFIPNLSIIDALFHCSIDETRHMCDAYELC